MIPGRGGVSALIKVFPLSSEQCIGVIASYTLDLLLLFLAYTKKNFFVMLMTGQLLAQMTWTALELFLVNSPSSQGGHFLKAKF